MAQPHRFQLKQLNFMSKANGVYDASLIPPAEVAEIDALGDAPVCVLMGLKDEATANAIAAHLSATRGRPVTAAVGAAYGAGKYCGVSAVLAEGRLAAFVAPLQAATGNSAHVQTFTMGPCTLYVLHEFQGVPDEKSPFSLIEKLLGAPPVAAAVICRTGDPGISL